MIKRKGNKFIIVSHTGKQLGSYDTQEEAEHRLEQIEWFKHHSSKVQHKAKKAIKKETKKWKRSHK